VDAVRNSRYLAGVTAPTPTAGSQATPAETASTRDRLVTAAIEVFRRDGYERARVQDIARAAGMTTGAIYANYRDKAELLLAAIARCSTAEVTDLLGGATGRVPEEVFRHLAGRLIAASPHRPLLLEAIAAAPRDPELAQVLRGVLGTRRAQLAALLDDLADRGALDAAVDRSAFVHLCLTLALGSVVARSLELEPPDPGAWSALIDRLLAAVAPPAHTPHTIHDTGQTRNPNDHPSQQ
jgi:AcrR family transcriptional regulator